jgi:pimeloyl-ACP methyl ester carboxylesterase
MKIYSNSQFKDQVVDRIEFEQWVSRIESHTGRTYERFSLPTSLGNTHVWGFNTQDVTCETLVIFPGARTTSLIWDLDRGLDQIGQPLRIFMVETNGLPNLSEGNTPDIKGLDYGKWATEVLDHLHLESSFVAGASFGALICMKMALVSPQRIKAAFLLNPGCLQPFSLSPKNLYYNLLPILKPTTRNVSKFLDKAIFSKPNHQLSEVAEQLLIDYEVFAISRYQDRTQKPYYMNKELESVSVPTYVLLGDQDLLFPYQKSVSNARRQLHSLRELKVFPQVGHGIETYCPALRYMGEGIREFK